MFGKRRRAASNPAQRAPPSASASLAATKAFVRDRESNPNLSNAAAAAALRTHATSPTQVGDTVTKRMVRRGSMSSNGSAQRPGLQRQNSSGSMTERSFRNSSPANAPPVPALPQDSAQSHRRASSLEPVYRGGSPAPRGGGRGVSLDRGSGSVAAGRGQRATSNLAQVVEDAQDNGRPMSVNFSRPMSPASAAKQNNSPQANKGWFGGPVVNQEAVQRMASTSRPKTSSGVTATDLHNTQQYVQNAATRPVQTHQIARGVEGSKLSSGSMRAKPSGTAVESRSFLQPKYQPPRGPVDPKSPDAIFDPSTRTFIHKQDAMARHRELNQEPESPVHDYVVQHLDDQPPQQISQPAPLPRTPSPARQDLQQPQPTVQKKTSADLPKLDISAAMRRPGDPPTGFPGHDQSQPTLERQHFEDLAAADIRPAEPRTVSPAPKPVTQPELANLESPRLAPNQDSSYPRLPNPVIPTTTNTVASTGRGSVRLQNGRGQSLSPQRNAHFAPVAIELAGVKHQPPPRSISPAKSALKSSPSVSRRGSSPVASNGRLSSRGASSEASDTTSEGGTMRRKKEVRVSFEATPVIAGTSAYAEAETPSTPAGLSASKWSPTREKDNEFEDFMKPRPALPSFGSIRDKERRVAHDDPPEKVTETVSSTPMSASIASVGEPLHTSSDHAIAGIVTQDFAQKQAKSNEPLPPEVTSVEGSGYISDSSDDLDSSPGIRKHGVLDDSSQILPDPEPKSLSAPHEEKPSTPASIQEQVIEVPDIALLPATPSPYEKPQPTFPSVAAPGGWTEDNTETEAAPAVVSPATSKPESTSPATQPAAPPTTLQELITRDEEDSSDDDNSSIYSDAYEDLSDTEGGFASIDAVVESPVVPSPGGLMFSKHADKSEVDGSGSGLKNETTVDDSVKPAKQSTQDWDATQQHWSGLNESRKQEAGVSAPADAPATPVVHKQERSRPTRELSSTESTPQKQTPSPRGKTQPEATQQAPRPLKSALKKTVVAPSVPAPEPQMRKTMRGPQPPRQTRAPEPQMRTTMRGPSLRENRGPEPQMRKTMRGGVDAPRAQPQMRTSMRGQGAVASNPTGLAASRHSMLPVEQKPPRGALQKRHIPASAMAPRPQSMPVAPTKQKAPVPTYDSDSDASVSSFRRTRSRPNAGQRTMRTSMRSGPTPTMRSAAPAAAPIRSISPPGSPTPALRKSMRPSSPTPDVPKSSRFSIRSLSPMGRFRNAKPIEAAPPSPTQPKKSLASNKASKQKAPAQVPARTKPVFKSRFADSSDEDEDNRPMHFQSRFADSDSEAELNDYQLPPGLAPVRGIPRKAGEEDGDSTDLEEEAEERPRLPAPTKEVGFKEVTNGDSKPQTNGNQGTALATGSLRDSKHAPSLPSFDKGKKPKTKRSFFGLGKKKSVTKPDATTSTPSTAPSDIPLPPSTIRRDTGPLTPIDEDKDIIPPPSPETKRSPKLQRRSTPEWPLPRNNIPVPSIPDDDRPMSSDGVGRRPRITKRQWSGTSNITTATAPVGTEGRAEVVGRSGKKKKFQGLRRVFGLND